MHRLVSGTQACLAALLLFATSHAMAKIDLSALWDFQNPAASEQRFREALATATGDDALILKTQIARSHGLRRDLARAREVLAEVQPALAAAGPEPQVRYWLEWGRSWISAVTKDAERTPEALSQARAAYTQAFDLAKAAALDGLAVDAVHMMAFVDTAPAEQLKWNDRGLALALASSQPAARDWEASLRNNRGMALKDLGRLDEALAEFKLMLAAREKQGRPRGIRIAHWMIAWTLRAMKRLPEARDIQLRLEKEWDADKQPDSYVYEELELIFKALNDESRAAHYGALLKAARAKP
jgi:tetratricopeptide (TPR) repeat protein